MVEVAQELIEADRTGSWQIHPHAISECLPIFAAAGHANYLKSGYLYLQNMNKLQTSSNVVFQKFMTGFHVIRRTRQYWDGLGSDLGSNNDEVSEKHRRTDKRKWHDRTPKSHMDNVRFYVISI